MMDVDANLSGYQELKQRYKSKVGFMSLLRSKLQEFYGLKDKINSVRAA
jgi:ADP-dependent phosphofructokinase/glucokinase